MGRQKTSSKMTHDVPPPTLRLKLDLDALASNWRALDQLSGSARAGAAVKANCYGLGVNACVPVLRDAGARDFFVAHWQEVSDVLAHVPAGQISVLHGVVNSQEAQFARETGVRPVINSLAQARRWNEAGGGPCDLMIDTGINRIGVAPDEVTDPVVQALSVCTLMSHLACADEDKPMNARQLTAFKDAAQHIEYSHASLANSAGIALGKDYACDITRPGLSLYGGIPRAELADHIRQVVFVEAVLLQLRTITAGETVGYNATFTAPRDMRIGVVSLGYADGILRAWGNNGAAFVHRNRRLDMLGKVSMDMIVVDLDDAPDLREGDWVELPYSLPDAARQSGLSQYELLTVLGRRFALK